jgi:hypothetical protein
MKATKLILIACLFLMTAAMPPVPDFTMTVNPQVITNQANTSDHTLSFDGQLTGPGDSGLLLIDNISGTIQFSINAAVDPTNSASYTSADKVVIQARRGQLLHHKGSAGSETYRIVVVPDI